MTDYTNDNNDNNNGTRQDAHDYPPTRPPLTVGYLCMCPFDKYQPTLDTVTLRRTVYYCKRCGRELGFEKMDKYCWSTCDGKRIPDNSPYPQREGESMSFFGDGTGKGHDHHKHDTSSSSSS
jgi:hypothetical protein